MITNDYINPKNSLVLFGLDEKLDFLINLYITKKFPKVLMISGKKGNGKFTLVNHFLTYAFDPDNYDIKNKDYIFGNGSKNKLPDNKVLIGSYHPSPRNVNTGRINKIKMVNLLINVKKDLEKK